MNGPISRGTTIKIHLAAGNTIFLGTASTVNSAQPRRAVLNFRILTRTAPSVLKHGLLASKILPLGKSRERIRTGPAIVS